MDLATPIPTIDAAVSARNLSTLKAQRIRVSQVVPPFSASIPPDIAENLASALHLGFLAVYAQGMEMLRAGSNFYGYGMHAADVASVWRAGCIIRSNMLNDIARAFHDDPGLLHLFADPRVASGIATGLPCFRKVIAAAVDAGIPTPALSASYNYVIGCASSRLPANLIQAQRDFFGAHTYERIDRPGNFHTEWR
jgi:6-phosphogluconate dehydrogenase